MVVLSHTSFKDILEPEKELQVPPLTRLLCTLGPSLHKVEDLAELMRIGMKVARIDLSWATAEWCKQAVANVREAERLSGCCCAIALDTAGPEIGVINVPDAPVRFKAGDRVAITSDALVSFSSQHIPIDYSLALGHTGLHEGSLISVDRYLATGDDVCSLCLVAEALNNMEVVCVVQNDCEFEGRSDLKVHIACMRNEMPILSHTDQAMLPELKSLGIHFLSLSFTRNEEDIEDARSFLRKHGMESMQIIAKVENKEGIVNHKAIIDAADAIIVSRGSMGVDLPPEKMFQAQKMLVKASNLAGKTVIVTRVVDTMVHAPRPTRAEATDVANLVLDGVDGILLGLETFSGVDPANASRTVLAICKQAETCFDHVHFYTSLMDQLGGFQYANLTKSEALASSAVRATQKLNARLIVAFSITGRTPRLLSKYRSKVPILAVIVPFDESSHSKAQCDFNAHQAMLLRGVVPIIADVSTVKEGRLATEGALTDWAVHSAVAKKMVVKGDRVIVSQCPRHESIIQGVFTEAGVVKFIAVGDDGAGSKTTKTGKVRHMQPIGSICDLSSIVSGSHQ